MKFYGREKQKNQLHNMFKTNCQMTALIYGRRRIGKSELIKQCLRESKLKSIYYECKQTTELNNVDSLSEIISDTLAYPKLAFGGIPYYNRLIDQNKSVRENVIELIASSGARLENEVSMYLNSEISKITNANEVFEALARGFSKYKDIYDQSHVSSGPTLVDVLNKLICMDIVKKEAQINDEQNKRKSGYYISDNLSLFYYKYIFRNASRMSIMDTNIFYNKYIHEDFETKHVPKAFKEIARQYLIRMNCSGRLKEPFEKIGKYYYDDPVHKKNGEFDIVTQDERGYIFYEAKFKKEPLTEQIIDKEIEQIKACGLSAYRYGFISKSGFKCRHRPDVILIDLDEMFR